jgi:AcrR family transcriptional regulator
VSQEFGNAFAWRKDVVVPKQVDHDARKREISEALLRLVAAGGLEAVSLRHVAAEAGISMGAVQHYFATKDEMLQFALRYITLRREQRITERLSAAPERFTVRSLLRTCLVDVLPTDEQRRAELLAGIAYFIRALREPRMAEVMAEGTPELIAFFADQLGAAGQAGELTPGVDVRQEAILLWSVAESQATSVVLGERTPDEAVATVDYYLDRLFRPSGNATS